MPATSPGQDDLTVAGRIGTGLVRLMRLVERAATTREGELDRPSFMLIYSLVCTGPSRVTALAAAVHSDPSTVSRQAAHLVELGLLERRADPADGRASLLAVTDEGMALLERARARRDERIAAITELWDPAEREQFAALLDRFATGYAENWAGRSSCQPPGEQRNGGAPPSAASPPRN
jgi:DNA-binding MarR family transcriptional regulator